LGYGPSVDAGLMDQCAVGNGIIKRKHVLQMGSGSSKPADKHQVSTGGQVTQDEPGGVVAPAAQTQQILVQALRQIEFAAGRVKARLPIGDVKERRGGTELLPQLSGATISMARFRRSQGLCQP